MVGIRDRGAPARRPVAMSGRGEDPALAAVGVWIVVAVHLDGRAHFLPLPDSGFTWWRRLMYWGVVSALMSLLIVDATGSARKGRLS